MTKTSSRNGEALAAIAGWAAFGLFWGGWGALIPEVKQAAGATDSELGVALLFVAAGALVSMPITGRLVDRFGERVLVPALALFAASIMLPAFSPSVRALAAALAVVGAASGAVDIALTARVVAIETRSDTPLMSRAHGVFALSAVVASVFVGLAREAGLGAAPIVAALAVPIASVAVVNGPFARQTRVAREPPLSRHRRRRVTAMVAFLGFLYALALLVENALEQWTALHLEETLAATPALGGLGPALFSLGLFLGRTLAFLYERRLGEWQTVRIAAGAAVGPLVLFALAPNALVGLVAVFAAGLAIAPAAPTIISFAGRSAAENGRGSAISGATTIGYLGYLLGPVIVGGVAGLAGLRAALLSVAVVSALLVIATLFRLPRRDSGGRDGVPARASRAKPVSAFR